MIAVVFTLALSFLVATFISPKRFWPIHGGVRRPIGGGIALRILPLGDSITEGVLSTDHNGYRLMLRNEILNQGNDIVHFIGFLAHGSDNPENHHEGWGGFRTIQILDRLTQEEVLQEQPNIVLLHAGTNDVNWTPPPPEPYEGTPQRLGNLIDEVLRVCPDTVLLVAKIINTAHSQERVDMLNSAIPGLVEERRKQGYKIMVVDHTNVGVDKLGDGLHPNDEGYRLMAHTWLQALQALPEGWIKSPT